MELILIRHGEPVREKRADGGSDPDLHERGRQQAELLAAYVAEEPVGALYSSSMRRALSTAEFVSRATSLEMEVDDDLVEFDHGTSEYIPVEELRATGDPRYEQVFAGDFSAWGIDVESFRRRAVEAVERIVSAHAGARVAVVCHGGVINAYLGHVLGVSKLLFFQPEYTSLHRVQAARSGERTITSVNEVTHLRSRRSFGAT